MKNIDKKEQEQDEVATTKQLKELERKLLKKLNCKADKETNKPPRPPNAYNEFVKKVMPEVKKNNPNASNKEAFKICAEMWNKEKQNKV